jgi:hypothetical protein
LQCGSISLWLVIYVSLGVSCHYEILMRSFHPLLFTLYFSLQSQLYGESC